MAPRAKNVEPNPPPVPSPADPKHNGQAPAAEHRMTDDEFREALYQRLMAQHRSVDAKLAEIDSGRKVISKQRTAIRNQLKQADYLLENVDVILKASNKSRGDEQGKVDQLFWMREIEALPNPKTGEQLDMLKRLPETEREAIMWEEDGYHQGVIDNEAKIPAGCPPIFHQRWLKKWHEGQERRAWALAQETNVERDPAKVGVIGFMPVELDDEPICEVCGGDGSKLADDVIECPECHAEYDAREP